MLCPSRIPLNNDCIVFTRIQFSIIFARRFISIQSDESTFEICKTIFPKKEKKRREKINKTRAELNLLSFATRSRTLTLWREIIMTESESVYVVYDYSVQLIATATTTIIIMHQLPTVSINWIIYLCEWQYGTQYLSPSRFIHFPWLCNSVNDQFVFLCDPERTAIFCQNDHIVSSGWGVRCRQRRQSKNTTIRGTVNRPQSVSNINFIRLLSSRHRKSVSKIEWILKGIY